MAKWDAYTYDFPGSTLDSTWFESQAGWVVTGNRLGIPSTGSDPSANVYTNNTGSSDLIASYIILKVEPDSTGGYVQINLQQWSNSANIVEIWTDITNSKLTVRSGGVTTDVGYSTLADVLWWRLREAAGTLYFDTSSTGTSWTNKWSLANASTTYTLNDTFLRILGGNWRANGTDYGYFSKFNLPPGGPPLRRRMSSNLLRR